MLISYAMHSVFSIRSVLVKRQSYKLCVHRLTLYLDNVSWSQCHMRYEVAINRGSNEVLSIKIERIEGKLKIWIALHKSDEFYLSQVWEKFAKLFPY